MPGMISCPNCNKSVNPQDLECQHCGVDLAIAAAVAENKVAEVMVRSPDILVTPRNPGAPPGRLSG